MPQVLPMTRVEAYLAYKAGVISEADLKPSLKTNFYSGLENWLAYWCGLTADYPKDENNDPKWYTEEEYYIAYLCGIAPDYPVNCYRRVGAYLRYIISARWDKPEKPLTREEYYLSLMSTTYLTPNEPASVISLSPTAEAPFGDLKIYGDCFQQTYTGKNLLPPKPATSNTRGTTTTVGEDGLITVTGTTTANFPWILDTPIDLPAGTYSLSFDIGLSIRFYTDSTNYIDVGGSGPTKTVTIASPVVRVLVLKDTGIGVDVDFSFRIQLENGSPATSYEPYVGGIAAPNPEFPMPVNVVTGEQTVQVIGKNFANIALANLEQVYITQSGERNYSSNSCTTISPIEVIAGQTFVCSYEEKTANSFLNYGHFFDDDGNYVGRTAVAIKHTPFTVPAGATKMYLTFYHNGGLPIASFGDYLANVQLELGSTSTDYVPYQGQSYEINLGKNLFDKTDSSLVFDGYLQAGTITLIAQAGNETIFIPCQPNTTYTVQKRFSTSGKNRFRIASFATLPTNGAVGTNLGGFSQADADTHNTATYTTSADAKYLAVFCYNEDSNVTFAQMLDSIQIELGSTATTYAPYFTPIELVKIGTHQDYIWNDGGTWKKHKEIDKILLNGDASEDWYLSAGPPARFRYENVPNIALQPYNASSAPVAYTKYFKGDNWYNLYENGITNIICSHNSVHRIAISAPQFTSVDLFKTWLSSHNMTVYYAMDTATDETITDAALISQLDALLEGGSYDYQTNIVVSAVDPNLPGLLQVTAAKWQ